MKEESAMSSLFGAARWVGGSLLVLGGSLLSCAATRTGATDADLARARDQASPGATVFSQECARCHGQRGEGLAGLSPILGPGALPEYPRDNSGPGGATMTDPQQLQIQIQTRPSGAPWRDAFRNAQDLYDFVSTHMPKSRAGALKPDDYWAVINFMVSVQEGSSPPPGGINASNARSISIPRP
jgi:mono/diheme cytochrome c family protein